MVSPFDYDVTGSRSGVSRSIGVLLHAHIDVSSYKTDQCLNYDELVTRMTAKSYGRIAS